MLAIVIKDDKKKGSLVLIFSVTLEHKIKEQL